GLSSARHSRCSWRRRSPPAGIPSPRRGRGCPPCWYPAGSSPRWYCSGGGVLRCAGPHPSRRRPRSPRPRRPSFSRRAPVTSPEFGVGGRLIRWPVYARVGTTALGTLLQQAALHVGPLSVSQPLLIIVDPLASIVFSVWLFGEHFTDSPAKILLATLAFAAMAAGVTMLIRTAPQDLNPSAAARP